MVGLSEFDGETGVIDLDVGQGFGDARARVKPSVAALNARIGGRLHWHGHRATGGGCLARTTSLAGLVASLIGSPVRGTITLSRTLTLAVLF
jgi:hypothetical protein